MNYQIKKSDFPLAVSDYLKWFSECPKNTNSFQNYLEYFFDAYTTRSENHQLYLCVNKDEYVKILKNIHPDFYDDVNKEFKINFVYGYILYELVEYFLSKKLRQKV